MRAEVRLPDPRIALVSVGLGRVQRGFERYFSDLFGLLRNELDVTLYKSGGIQSSCEKVPPLLRTATAIARVLPLGPLVGSAEYNRDCLAFGLSLLPQLLHNSFNVIHCIDPPLAFVLERLKRICRFRARLLFTEGSVMPPRYYPRVDHVHHVAPAPFQGALAMGVPESHMTLIPCGLHTRRFATALDRQELRRKYGVSEGTFVILAVSAVKQTHKRVDYIIEEVSHLDGDVLLWIDGNLEDRSVPELAQRKLGQRCRITHMPSRDVPELYHSADVMVHASLTEAFGLAVVEALCSGLMVLTHDSPHFEWLVQDRCCLVDMRVPGNLARRLRELAGRREELFHGAQARAASVRRRFDWSALTPIYVEMYRRIAALSFTASAGR